jgi:hypothetical protein
LEHSGFEKMIKFPRKDFTGLELTGVRGGPSCYKYSLSLREALHWRHSDFLVLQTWPMFLSRDLSITHPSSHIESVLFRGHLAAKVQLAPRNHQAQSLKQIETVTPWG